MAGNATNTGASLQSLMEQAGGAVNLLRGAPLGRYVFPKIPPEFTNFRDEIRAWKSGVAMLEQSYHMCELHLRGPQVIDLLSELSVNKLAKFPTMRAKQLVMCGHEGDYLADAIIFHEEDDFYRIVGAPFASDWVQYNAGLGEYDVEASIDLPLSVREGDRSIYRLQVQGRDALALMEQLTGGNVPEIRFFHIGEMEIAGRKVRALRHGMAGEPGFELYGPWEDQHIIRAAILEAGKQYGIRKVGADAYSVTGIESGWMPMPLPAIYHGEDMRPYREWLTTNHLETIGSLGGSFVSDDIRDYYVNPLEVGYGNVVDWDRNFIGREGLGAKKQNLSRTKRSLVWNQDDVRDVISSSLFAAEGEGGKYMNIPSPMHATFEADSVTAGGKRVGLSNWSAFSPNVGSFLSLAIVDIDHAEPGTEVTLLWGEPDSRRPSIEKHQLREIRATVAPAPYFEKVIKSGKQ